MLLLRCNIGNILINDLWILFFFSPTLTSYKVIENRYIESEAGISANIYFETLGPFNHILGITTIFKLDLK